MKVEHDLDIFNALEGRYPKDYDEFMTRIIKANGTKLPVLPGGWTYAYDVPNHKLEVVPPRGPSTSRSPPGNNREAARCFGEPQVSACGFLSATRQLTQAARRFDNEVRRDY